MRAEHLWFFGYKPETLANTTQRDISESYWKAPGNKGNINMPG